MVSKIVFLRHAVRKPCNECLQQGMLERWRSAKSSVRLPLRCLNSRKHRCEVSLKQAGLLTYLSPWTCLPANAQMACSGLWWPRFGENHSSGYCRRFARRSLLIALHGAQTDSITAKLQQYFDSQSFFSIIPPLLPESASGGASAACDVPRRCRGLTESETARAVMLCHCCERRGRCYVGALETRYYGSGASESVEGEVRRADPFSVNPGQRVRG